MSEPIPVEVKRPGGEDGMLSCGKRGWTGRVLMGAPGHMGAMAEEMGPGADGAVWLLLDAPHGRTAGKAKVVVSEPPLIRLPRTPGWTAWAVASSGDLTGPELSYLASLLTEKIRSAGAVKLRGRKGAVPGAGMPVADGHCREMLDIFAVLGLGYVFQQPADPRPGDEPRPEPPAVRPPPGTRLVLTGPDTLAEGSRGAGGRFVVFKGSYGRIKTAPSFPAGRQRDRARLQAAGSLIAEDGRLLAVEDIEFKSAAAAATVMRGAVAGNDLWQPAGPARPPEPPQAANPRTARRSQPSAVSYAPCADEVHLRGKQASATGVETPEGGMHVFKGARGRASTSPSFPTDPGSKRSREQRQRMIKTGALQLDGDDLLLVEDCVFSSPSRAAGVLLGCKAGLSEWATKDGVTLKEIRASAGAPPPGPPPQAARRPPAPGNGTPSARMQEDDPLGRQHLHLDADGTEACAEGAETDDGFVVYAASYGRLTPDPSFWEEGSAAAPARKSNLMRMGAIIVEDGTLRLAQDCAFASASEAASVLLGTNADGQQSWKNADGETLGELKSRGH